MLQLLQKGKDANAASDFATAAACFEAAYALSVRPGMLVSAANMRLKLGEAVTASAMCVLSARAVALLRRCALTLAPWCALFPSWRRCTLLRARRYRMVLADSGLLANEREMASRKLAEAQVCEALLHTSPLASRLSPAATHTHPTLCVYPTPQHP